MPGKKTKKTVKGTTDKQGKAIAPETQEYREAQERSREGHTVKPQPDPDWADIKDPKRKRIEYLRAKSDRTLEEGLELQELELGLEKSKEINAGYTSDRVEQEQDKLRAEEEKIKEKQNKDK